MAVSPTPAPRLIPPPERIRFVAAYVFITVITWVLVGAFFSFSSLIPNATARATLDAIVTGLMVGVGQWFVLRTYIPGWMWIVATAVGSGLVTLAQSLWYLALLNAAQQPDSNHFLNFFLNTPLSIILPMQGMTILAFCLWFAGAQWLVLRQYVKGSVWWFLTPAIAILLVWILAILQLVLLFSVVLQQQVLLPGLLAATQALMLCWFQRKESSAINDGDSSVDSANSVPFAALVVGTIAGVLVLSLSMQGFLIWFRNA